MSMLSNPVETSALLPGQAEFEQARKIIGNNHGDALTVGFDLYLNAAKMGHTEAQYLVGIMCRDGVGTRRHADTAETWLLHASMAGHVEATEALHALTLSEEHLLGMPSPMSGQLSSDDAAATESLSEVSPAFSDKKAQQRADRMKVAARKKARKLYVLIGVLLIFVVTVGVLKYA